MRMFIFYLQYPFVRYAIIVGILIALCSSLLGVTLVLKRYSLIGDGLSHMAFGAATVAGVLHFTNDIYLILPITIICAVFLLNAGPRSKVKGDAAIAMMSVGALSFGYLIINMFSTSGNVAGDVCGYLFGSTSILTLSQNEVTLSIVLSALVIAVFVLFYNKIFAVTFDEDFSKAVGTNVKMYNTVIAVITAVIITLAMNLVGSLLISALIVFPALCSMRMFNTFKAVTISSAVISVVCVFLGMFISIVFGTPVGSTIVAFDVLMFFVSCIAGRILRRS